MAAMMVFVVFLVGIALSIPIGVSMILGSVAPIMLLGKGGTIVQVLNNTFSGANSTPILAVPLFILGGVIMAEGGISKKLFNFFAYFVGRFPGGVPCAVIMTCLFYGAISGSGPAYVYLFIESMIDASVQLGLPRPLSEKIILQTILGSAAYMKKAGKHPVILKNEVTSPGGTTAAALAAMEKEGLRTAVTEGMIACLEKTRELGKK